MRTKTKNQTNYVDALENELRYAVLTKRGRMQVLIQPTAKQLRKRGKRGWRLFSTVVSGCTDAGHTLTEAIQRAIQAMEGTGQTVENNGKKRPPAAQA
jgi:hypothetical protein